MDMTEKRERDISYVFEWRSLQTPEKNFRWARKIPVHSWSNVLLVFCCGESEHLALRDAHFVFRESSGAS